MATIYFPIPFFSEEEASLILVVVLVIISGANTIREPTEIAPIDNIISNTFII